MVVELCGLPGAGKTPLAAALASALRQRGCPVDQPAAAVAPGVGAPTRLTLKSRLTLRHAAGAPADAVTAGRLVWGSRQGSRADALARLVQWTVAQRLVATAAARPGVHVLDEGVVQALWSIGLRGDVTAMLDAIATGRLRSAAADAVLLVEADPAEAARRLEARASRHSRVQQGTGGALVHELERGHALLERLAGWREASVPGSELLRVPEEWGPSDVAALADRIVRLAGG